MIAEWLRATLGSEDFWLTFLGVGVILMFLAGALAYLHWLVREFGLRTILLFFSITLLLTLLLYFYDR